MQNSDTLLKGMSEQDQKLILDLCTQRRASPREIIFSQGSTGRDMFIVTSGSFKVSVLSEEGKEISFVVLRRTDYFGELSMIDGRRRSATVTAIEDSELQVLPFAEYQQLLQAQPHTASQFLTFMLLTLSNRLRATDELYQDSVFLDVSARLAKFLLNASAENPQLSKGSRSLDIQLSQYELGTLINASRESVNKQLRDWESRGLIEIEQGIIVLKDPDYLQRKADLL